MLILRGKRVSPMDEVLKPRKLLKKDPETMAVELKEKNLEKEKRTKRAENLRKTKRRRRDHPGEGRGERGQEKEKGKGKEGVPDRIP